MDILPLKSVREDDALAIPSHLLNLAKLLNLGFPVPEGIIVTPPEVKLKTILLHHQIKDREIFEQRLTLIKKEICQIPLPEELDSILIKRKVDAKSIWHGLLEVWLNEIKSRIWREGFSSRLTSNLTAQLLFFLENIKASGEAFFDPLAKQVIVENKQGKLTLDEIENLQKLVQIGNSKLFISQEYHWVIVTAGQNKKREIKIVKVMPFTQVKVDDKAEFAMPAAPPEAKVVKDLKSSVKVYLDLNSGFSINEEVDGIFLKAEKAGDFEETVYKLSESAITFPHSTVIYRLADNGFKFAGIRGTFQLLQQKNMLKQQIEAFLFCRNKRSLLNIQLGVPFTRTVYEFLELKKELMGFGVSRKGSLKLWLELSIPENILNLKKYTESGLDGVIFNLDELSGWLGGFNPYESENISYKAYNHTLIEFLRQALKLLHQENIPILAVGSLVNNDEVLEFLVENGVTGLIAGLETASFMHQHLRFIEKRIVKKKL